MKSIDSTGSAHEQSRPFVFSRMINRINPTILNRLILLAISIVVVIVVVGPKASLALRTGAPAMACLSMRPMHGLNRAKPASASQFFIRQSSLSYLPGEIIEVDLMTYSDERHFKGFMLQAQDPTNGHHIGHFAPTKESRPIDSCSATTHRDNSDKQRVKLVWLSPGASLPPGTDLGSPTRTSAWRNPIQPNINLSLLHKRQLVGVSTNVTNISNTPTLLPTPADTPSAADGSETPSASPPAPSQAPFAPVKKQVRFRATIVVSYDDFYTGFESSDLRYDAFTFANVTSA